MADSYSITYNTTKVKKDDLDLTNFRRTNDACFSSFNSDIKYYNQYIDKATIIIERSKLEKYTDEEVYLFLENIKKAGTLDFTIEQNEDEFLLELVIPKNVKKAQLQYTGMLVRSLYEPRKTDQFQKIAKHFMNMCKLFKNANRGILFTTACNIFITEYEQDSGYNIYNGNHILMSQYGRDEGGCHVLRTSNIKKILKKDRGINDNFTDNNMNVHDTYSVSSSPVKKDYLKIFKVNGIKYR
jgi:hypothetical protein